MTKERIEELRKIIATAEEKGWTMDVSVAREMMDAIEVATVEFGGDGGPWAVFYGNYFPRETDSTWSTKEKAQARVDLLNDMNDSPMWEVAKS